MSQNEIISKVTELQELRRMAEDLAAEIESLQDAIKAHMIENDIEHLTTGAFKVSYKAVTSSRLDTSALKKAMPEIVAQYTKTTTTRRFSVN